MAVVVGHNTVVLGTPFNIPSVDTWSDTGLVVTLPSGLSSGNDFTVVLDVRSVLGPNIGSTGGSWITIKLVVDDGSPLYDYPNSERLLVFVDSPTVNGGSFQSNQSFSFKANLGDGSLTTKIRLYAILKGCTTGYSIARIESNSDGLTVISLL